MTATEPAPNPPPTETPGGGGDAAPPGSRTGPPIAAPRRLALGLAAAAALAVGLVVALRVAPIEPSLVLHLIPAATTATTQVFDLRAEPRGGETIDAVRLEIAEGHVEVFGRRLFLRLTPDNAARFTLRIRRDAPSDPLVRLHQEGRVNRTYEMRLPVDRR